MTALTMFLPSIPVSSGKHLPALFNIYTRMLFWDRERILSPSLRRDSMEKDNTDDSEPQIGEKSAWEKLSYSFESDDETLPELSNYFTFLYGLYPINFMSYIRKPSRYLRHANFPGADDIEVEPSEIRQRSEPFRRLHLLHPNFFTLTIESELTDANRWMKSPTSDVVTACMALCVLVGHIASTNPSTIRLSSLHSARESNRDIPSQPLVSHDLDDNYSSPRLSGASSGNIGNVSWRNTTSTIVASPDAVAELSALRRLSSRNSQSVSSDLNSPTSQPQDVRSDSPGMHNLALSHSHGGVQDMLNSQKSLHGNLQQSLPNESSTTVSSAQLNDSSMTVDSYLQSLAQHPPRSPSLRPSAHDGQSNIGYLHREIMLLKNDLNFERYLKQQHLAHIGQLRRMQVREATVEAETQNLINSNKILKGKLDEAKSITIQIKKEFEKSRAQSRKWEADLTAKLRAIKEDQKQWLAESESLREELVATKEYCEQLKQLVISSEARELSSSRKLQSVQVELGELDKLRADVERLTEQLRGFQAQERENERVKASEDVALTKIELLEMQLKARDNELQKTRKANVREIDSLRSQLEMATTGVNSKQTKNFQSMLDSALAASRSRLTEAQKAHAHLLKQYTALEQQYLNLQEQQDSTGPLLGEGMQSYMSESPTSEYRRDPYHSHFDDRRDIFRTSDDSAEFRRDPYRDMSDVSPRSSTPTRMPMRMDATMRSSTASSSSHGILRTISRGGSDAGVGSANGETDKAGPVKIKPQSEIRVYGRGSLLRDTHFF
jgi:solute carrier family 25 protein 16